MQFTIYTPDPHGWTPLQTFTFTLHTLNDWTGSERSKDVLACGEIEIQSQTFLPSASQYVFTSNSKSFQSWLEDSCLSQLAGFAVSMDFSPPSPPRLQWRFRYSTAVSRRPSVPSVLSTCLMYLEAPPGYMANLSNSTPPILQHHPLHRCPSTLVKLKISYLWLRHDHNHTLLSSFIQAHKKILES